MSRPPILIPHASGTNRDGEAALAVEHAGGAPRIAHINELRSGRVRFADHAAVLLPGGFSYGDELGAGARLALDLRVWFGDELRSAVDADRPILGICNGFQALVKSGLLDDDAPSTRRVTLTENANGRFECRWVTLDVADGCRAEWLRGLTEPIRCPVAHGEGRIAVSSDETLDDLERSGRIAFRYLDGVDPAAGRYPANPNGSAGDIAGLCDPTGRVVGLMPHPEDHIVDWQRPNGAAGGRGLPLFERFVRAAS